MGRLSTLLILLVGIVGMNSQLSDTATLYTKLLSGYNKRLLPLYNQSATVVVNVGVSIININGFDEMSGGLALTLGFSLSWTEERMTWTPGNYSGKQDMLFDINDVWRPRFQIKESINHIQEIGSSSDLVRVDNSGKVSWLVGNVVQVFCSVDVTFFPFDEQSCTISFSSSMYTISELLISVNNEDVMTSDMSQNSMWILKKGKVLSVDYIASISVGQITLYLKRRSEFYVVYVIVPLLFLGLVNSCVFIMPSTSGERHSVAITTFLAFVLYMSVIDSIVPQSSSPLAYIYYYLLFLIMYSSSTMFLCIVSTCLHQREEPVPPSIQNVVRSIRCRGCTSTKPRSRANKEQRIHNNSIHSELQSDKTKDDLFKEQSLDDVIVEQGELRTDEISWTLVANTFDTVCLILLTVLFVMYSTGIFLKLYTHSAIY